MTTTTFSVLEISCDTCKNAIEGAVAPTTGVAEVSVDVSGKTVTVRYDERLSADRLVELIEEQGYDVADRR